MSHPAFARAFGRPFSDPLYEAPTTPPASPDPQALPGGRPGDDLPLPNLTPEDIAALEAEAGPPPPEPLLTLDEMAPLVPRSRIDWASVARLIAMGVPITTVGNIVCCSRTTIWRALKRSPRLSRRIAAEREKLAAEAWGRLDGMRNVVSASLEREARRGNVRVLLWLAERLRVTAREVAAMKPFTALPDGAECDDEDGMAIEPAADAHLEANLRALLGAIRADPGLLAELEARARAAVIDATPNSVADVARIPERGAAPREIAQPECNGGDAKGTARCAKRMGRRPRHPRGAGAAAAAAAPAASEAAAQTAELSGGSLAS